MTQKITHVCQGTCSRQIDVELENGVVRSVSFTGGCHGNTQGIAALVRGMKAPQTAGIIHTDFEKGFIRAEVIKYDDYVALGSEKACRDAGKIGIEGKEYVVQDGDIMHFLFNV